MSVRLFNPSTLEYAYAIAKVQDVLWTKKWSCIQDSRFHNGGTNNFHHTGELARTKVNSNGNQTLYR